jgi:hypothetical protein
MPGVIAFLLPAAAAIVATILLLRCRADLKRLRIRYAPIIDIGAERARLKDEVDRARDSQEKAAAESERQCKKLAGEYAQALSTYEDLKREVALLEENLEDISFGLYRPHFTFETSAEYKAKLEATRERERGLIHANRAAVCNVQWVVGGSKTEGQRMARQNTKLVLRAFNGECDAAVAKVAWNNIERMEERIQKAHAAINKLGTVLQVSLSDEFLRLKLDELRLTHEYEEKKHAEQEEQRRIREEMREEEKARQEIEQARKEAEREETTFEKALEQARAEAVRATGAQVQELSDRIRALQAQLEEARRQKERAISLAQLTKAGYVYVISNIGSFGQDVYKVGMTRRWEPMERIRELSGASVPFAFDVHAMIYSENAPDLEYALHQWMDERRMNLVNPRKEFFQVTLAEIEDFARRRGLTVEFAKLAEAKEYRETIAARSQRMAQPQAEAESERFPVSLFAGASAEAEPAPVGQ